MFIFMVAAIILVCRNHYHRLNYPGITCWVSPTYSPRQFFLKSSCSIFCASIGVPMKKLPGELTALEWLK